MTKARRTDICEVPDHAEAAYLAQAEREHQMIQDGLDDVTADRLISMAGMESWADSLGTDHELPLPKARGEGFNPVSHTADDTARMLADPAVKDAFDALDDEYTALRTILSARRSPELEPVLTLQIPTTGLREFIAELAKRHGVTYVMDGYAALARVITRLSDDEVVPDETEKLVIALRRAEVIDGTTMVTLLGRYFDETRAADL